MLTSRSPGILDTDGTQGRWIGRQFVLSSRILGQAQEGRKDVHVLVGAQAARIARGHAHDGVEGPLGPDIGLGWGPKDRFWPPPDSNYRPHAYQI